MPSLDGHGIISADNLFAEEDHCSEVLTARSFIFSNLDLKRFPDLLGNEKKNLFEMLAYGIYHALILDSNSCSLKHYFNAAVARSILKDNLLKSNQ